jgi:hypothetical protein
MTDPEIIKHLTDIISKHYTCFKDDEKEALYAALYIVKGKQKVIEELREGIDSTPDDDFDQGGNFGISYALKVINMYMKGKKENET